MTGAPPPPRDPTVDECIEIGLRHFGREELAEARVWWHRALAIDPQNARATECLRVLSQTLREQTAPAWTGERTPAARGSEVRSTRSAPAPGAPWSGGTPEPWTVAGTPAPWSAAGTPAPWGATGGAAPWVGAGTPGPWTAARTPAPWSATSQPPSFSQPFASSQPWTGQGTPLPPWSGPTAPPTGVSPAPGTPLPPWSAAPAALSPAPGTPLPPPALGRSPSGSPLPPGGPSALNQWSRPTSGRSAGPPFPAPRSPTADAPFDARAGARDEALPPGRTFSLDAGQGAIEPTPEELLDDGRGLDLVVEDPEEFGAELFGEDALTPAEAMSDLDRSMPLTPWDLGPSETSIVTLDDAADTAVAELTPLPRLEPVPSSVSPLPRPSRPEPSPPPAAIGLLRKANDRMQLHDFAGALELLDQISSSDPAWPEAEPLLREARRRIEVQCMGKLGTLDRIPQQILSDDQLIWLNLDHRAGYLLSRVDGIATFDDLIALSGMPRLDALRILASLLNDGVIG